MTMMHYGLRSALAAAAILGVSAAQPALAAGEAIEIPRQKWSFSGPAGHFDQAQLQRGFLVYKEVCSTCHGLKRIAYRNLMQKGGPAFAEAGVRTLAAEAKIEEIDPNSGKVVTRPGRLSDRLPSPYKNEAEARATHNGAYPPDLSLIAKGRNVEYTGSLWFHPLSMARDIATGYQEGGADYLYALLTGYKENAPAYRREASGRLVAVPESSVARGDKSILRCVTVEKGAPGRPDTCNELAEGMHYNTSFPGHQIGMANPLQANDQRLKFADGTTGTISNYAADVAAFLSWAADPHHDERKDMGWQVMLYLLITAVLLYLTKKRIWRDAH